MMALTRASDEQINSVFGIFLSNEIQKEEARETYRIMPTVEKRKMLANLPEWRTNSYIYVHNYLEAGIVNFDRMEAGKPMIMFSDFKDPRNPNAIR